MSYMSGLQHRTATAMEDDGWYIASVVHGLYRQTTVKMIKSGMELTVYPSGTMKLVLKEKHDGT